MRQGGRRLLSASGMTVMSWNWTSLVWMQETDLCLELSRITDQQSYVPDT